MNFLSCGDCTACCDGNLIGEVYGIPFGNGVQCSFLCNKKCTIYDVRPQMCRKYQCAWTQGLFPEWMKPTLSGVLVSVEQKNNKKFLKVIPINKHIDQKVKDFLDNWVEEHNTFYELVGVNYEAEPGIRSQTIRWLSKR